jgi:hypothetical protein
MLDVKGITLDEVTNRYPRGFQVLGYDTPLEINALGKPKVISTFEMSINVVLTLLMMKPGQYPSIPELGIDIEHYLHEYSDDKNVLDEIKTKLNDQCNKLQLTGIKIDVSFDRTDPSLNALVIMMTGTEKIAYGSESNQVIIGITYDQLNRLYMKKQYI